MPAGERQAIAWIAGVIDLVATDHAVALTQVQRVRRNPWIPIERLGERADRLPRGRSRIAALRTLERRAEHERGAEVVVAVALIRCHVDRARRGVGRLV